MFYITTIAALTLFMYSQARMNDAYDMYKFDSNPSIGGLMLALSFYAGIGGAGVYMVLHMVLGA